MSLRYAKILSSGSPAEVTSITASVLPEISGTPKNSLIFADNTGKFYTSSKIFFTASNNGQFVLDEINLRCFTLTASGVPDSLTNLSSVLFINEGGGVETTSSLRYLTDSNTLAFDGIFSGSFTGDGSGLTGVIGNTAQPLANGPGLISQSGGDFEYNGAARVDLTLATASDGGLEFEGGGVRLASSLPGNGLEWRTQYNSLGIKLSGSISESGLNLVSGGLSLTSSIAGNGLKYTAGVLEVELADASGLQIPGSGQLKLISTLPGRGLTWITETSVLGVDLAQAVTSSTELTFLTSSNNIEVSATAGGSGVTLVNKGVKARLIDAPNFTFGINNNLVGDFVVNGDFNVFGDYIVTQSAVALRSSNLNIADQFILVASGSETDTQGGFQVQTGVNESAFLLYKQSNNVWAVSKFGIGNSTIDHNLTLSSYGIISTTQLTTQTEAVIINSNPIFGTNDATRAGQTKITTNASTGESPLYIFV